MNERPLGRAFRLQLRVSCRNTFFYYQSAASLIHHVLEISELMMFLLIFDYCISLPLQDDNGKSDLMIRGHRGAGSVSEGRGN